MKIVDDIAVSRSVFFFSFINPSNDKLPVDIMKIAQVENSEKCQSLEKIASKVGKSIINFHLIKIICKKSRAKLEINETYSVEWQNN